MRMAVMVLSFALLLTLDRILAVVVFALTDILTLAMGEEIVPLNAATSH